MSSLDPVSKDTLIEIQEKINSLTEDNFYETINFLETTIFFTNSESFLYLLDHLITISYCNWFNYKIFFRFATEILKDAHKKLSFSYETDYYNLIDGYKYDVPFFQTAHKLTRYLIKQKIIPENKKYSHKYPLASDYSYFYGYNKELYKIVVNDDIDSFVSYASSPEFSYDMTLPIVQINWILFYNSSLHDHHLIDIVALANSIKIFKTIILSSPTSLSDITLYRSICSGNLEMIHICMQNGIEPKPNYILATIHYHRNYIYDWLKNMFPDFRDFKIEEAYKYNNFHAFFDLIEQGFTLDSTGVYGDFYQVNAVNGNHFDMVKYIIKYLSNNFFFMDYSILGQAITKNSTLLLRIILNKKNLIKNMDMAIQYAIYMKCSIEIIKYLVDYEPNAITYDVNCLAALNDRIDCLEYFKKTNINNFTFKRNKSYEDPLFNRLIRYQQYNAFIYLCQNYTEFIDLKERDKYLFSALEKCVVYDYVEGIKELVTHTEIDINEVNTFSDDFAPIHFAVIYHSSQSLNYFLYENDNVNVNIKDKNGNTSLALAIRRKYSIAIVKLLLECEKININTVSNDGLTPLSLAIKNGYTECIDMLLNHPKIDINAGKETPLETAAFSKNTSIIQKILARKDLILEKTCLNIEILSEYSDEDKFHLIESLITKGYNINKYNNNGETLLHMSILSKSTELSKFLLSENIKADPFIIDKKENLYPIHLCAKVGEIEIAKMLLNFPSINNNIEGILQRTPMHIASYYNQYEFIFALSSFFDTNKKDRNRETPLDISIRKHFTNVVESLCADLQTDITSKSYLNRTPLKNATLYHYKDISTVIQKHINIRKSKLKKE